MHERRFSLASFMSHPAIAVLVALIIFLLLIVPLAMNFTKAVSGPDYQGLVAVCALIGTVFIALFSVIPNLRSLEHSSRYAHYSELDSMYHELLKIALEHPNFRNPARLPKSWAKDRAKYNIYAFMVWNFLETIHDRCEADRRLRATWEPVIRVEHKIHEAWFDAETRPWTTKTHPKFCLEFCDFIWLNYSRERAPPDRSEAGFIPEALSKLRRRLEGSKKQARDRWSYRPRDEIEKCDLVRPYSGFEPQAETVAAS